MPIGEVLGELSDPAPPDPVRIFGSTSGTATSTRPLVDGLPARASAVKLVRPEASSEADRTFGRPPSGVPKGGFLDCGFMGDSLLGAEAMTNSVFGRIVPDKNHL